MSTIILLSVIALFGLGSVIVAFVELRKKKRVTQ